MKKLLYLGIFVVLVAAISVYASTAPIWYPSGTPDGDEGGGGYVIDDDAEGTTCPDPTQCRQRMHVGDKTCCEAKKPTQKANEYECKEGADAVCYWDGTECQTAFCEGDHCM